MAPEELSISEVEVEADDRSAEEPHNVPKEMPETSQMRYSAEQRRTVAERLRRAAEFTNLGRRVERLMSSETSDTSMGPCGLLKNSRYLRSLAKHEADFDILRSQSGSRRARIAISVLSLKQFQFTNVFVGDIGVRGIRRIFQ